jgi:hypothetical protein
MLLIYSKIYRITNFAAYIESWGINNFSVLNIELIIHLQTLFVGVHRAISIPLYPYPSNNIHVYKINYHSKTPSIYASTIFCCIIYPESSHPGGQLMSDDYLIVTLLCIDLCTRRNPIKASSTTYSRAICFDSFAALIFTSHIPACSSLQLVTPVNISVIITQNPSFIR